VIALFAMPEDPAEIPGWFTTHLLGPELPAVVGELRAYHRPGPPPTLNAVLGSHRAIFLERGFDALPRDVLSRLLRNPDLLLELPELVYAEGGRVWFASPLSAEEQRRAANVADRAHAALLAGPRRPSGWWKYAGVCIATAAAVLLAVWVGGGFRTAPAPSGWGFAKLKQVPRGEPKVTFSELAALVGEWGNKPPTDRESLAKRLSEFRLGCSQLQAADLGLPPADSDWLKGRCVAWSAALDGHLRTLDETGDTAAVLAAASETVRGIRGELLQRAG
jgi:hypothetical protein